MVRELGLRIDVDADAQVRPSPFAIVCGYILTCESLRGAPFADGIFSPFPEQSVELEGFVSARCLSVLESIGVHW